MSNKKDIIERLNNLVNVLVDSNRNAVREIGQIATSLNTDDSAKGVEVVSVSDDNIRDIFLQHGFKIKEGESDLKPYVFKAAHALVRFAQTGSLAEQPGIAPIEVEQPDTAALSLARGKLVNVLLRYLSPEVTPLGKGFIKPAVWSPNSPDYQGKLIQYKEDVFALDIEHLLKWPSGFYRRAADNALQLFLKLESCWLMMAIPSDAEPTPETALQLYCFFFSEDGEGVSRSHFLDIEESRLTMMAEQLEAALQKLAQ